MAITAGSLGRTLRAVPASLLAAAFYWAAPAEAGTLHATDDTTVLVGVPATQGALPTLNVGNSGVARHGFARFDLSTLPNGATGADIDSATLRIYPVVVRRPGTLEVHRVDGPWDEGTLTGAGAPPLDPLPVDAVPVAAADAGSFLTADVTTLVRDWVDGIVPNDGLALISTGGADVVLESKESRLGGNALEIEVALAVVVDTSAATECGPGEVLDGDGNCVAISSITPDTNAATECSGVSVLLGDGNCRSTALPLRMRIQRSQATVNPNIALALARQCPANEVIVSGGSRIISDGGGNTVVVNQTAPLPGGNGWRVEVSNTHGSVAAVIEFITLCVAGSAFEPPP